MSAFFFFIETDNICVVAKGQTTPVPRSKLPKHLELLPGNEFAVMNITFQSMLAMLLVISIITTTTYIIKIIAVFKFHKKSSEDYKRYASPAVRTYKVWNFIFALALISCGCIFASE